MLWRAIDSRCFNQEIFSYDAYFELIEIFKERVLVCQESDAFELAIQAVEAKHIQCSKRMQGYDVEAS